jgi:glycosidase
MSDESLRNKLVSLYGTERGARCHERLLTLLEDFRSQRPDLSAQPVDPAERITEQDVMLITYGDSLQKPGMLPLEVLHRFLRQRLQDVLSAVHILPFFPYSSDDGFAVIDYQAVDPALGDWQDIRRIGRDFKLMFDAVINHISAQSGWFKGFLSGEPECQDFFIVVDPATDLSGVVRPRSLPLLTEVPTHQGSKYVWTTFSADQIDLNFASEDVLLKIVEVLLFYVSQGMSFIRLDAIAYLWKEIGTPCIHLPQTHTVVRLFRDIFDAVAPHVTIITETNVPHAENVSYFGSGSDEAQLVYQFTLPPLVLHAIATGDATVLSEWAAGINKLSNSTTFFNFTASHDGIGVRPVEGILSAEQVAALCERAKAHGGAVSYKTNSDGSQSPYELNINYFDALSDPNADEPLAVQVGRFITSQAIQLAFMGMPGIYIHSLLGSRNWNAGVEQTGHLRTINREKLDLRAVEAELDDPATRRGLVFNAYRNLISLRVGERAFHPNGAQQVLRLHPALFTLLRTSPDGREHVAAIHNVSNQNVTIDLEPIPVSGVRQYRDLVSGIEFSTSGSLAIAPYQVLWLKTGENQ